MEVNEQMELTVRQAAQAVGKEPHVVRRWINRKEKPLAAFKPFFSDRIGHRTTVADLRDFLRNNANDGGRSEKLLNQWLQKNGQKGEEHAS